jgi:UDP-N-acetylglucosamine 2-epimerase (non-hydrolysing)
MTSSNRLHVLSVVGARPNFMKIAPIVRAFKKHGGFRSTLVHTGQHYDVSMKEAFFVELDIPVPDVDLGVGSGTHAVQTAEVMRRFEPEIERFAPDAVLVVGDVNSTLACTLVAAKLGVPVVHVEAGLRSFDRAMPEEINRVLTDQLADLLFTTEAGALDNLVREGIEAERVRFVGNVMIDTLMHCRARCPLPGQVLERVGSPFSAVSDGAYAVLTLHRPSNVDSPSLLASLVETVAEVSRLIPVVFPVHPRSRSRLEASGLLDAFGPNVALLSPLGYLDMLALTSGARVVLTDSGGLQEETTALGVPCITLRSSTERPITVTEGTNTVVGTDSKLILDCAAEVLASGGKAGCIPDLWDGRAAERIASELKDWARKKDLGSV